jgi:TetR/AcrR family transcriptional repressor of nem operon
MMGTLVLSRIAGSGELSEEVLQAGKEAALARAAALKPATPKPTARRARAKVNGVVRA